MRAFKHPYLVEAGLWAFAFFLAFAFGYLVAPGWGKPRLDPPRDPVDCVAWTELEQREVPTGRLLGTSRYCREWK